MNREILVLAGTAAAMGLIHTVIGPDHYIPFIAMSRARRWSMAKTLVISFFAGLGHILSSVILGFVGLAFGIAVAKLENAESVRGRAAAWLLIAFGFVYFIWGLHRAIKNKPHTHAHAPRATAKPTTISTAMRPNTATSMTVPAKPTSRPGSCSRSSSSGPASRLSPSSCIRPRSTISRGVVFVTARLRLTTILTMLTIIAACSWGISFVRLGKWERFSHAMAGAHDLRLRAQRSDARALLAYRACPAVRNSL